MIAARIGVAVYYETNDMTLIAGFSINKLPCLIGDVVISGPEKNTDSDVVIPTVGRIGQQFSQYSYNILDTQQKLHIISDTVAIAWAGSSLVARMVVMELITICENSNELNVAIKQYLRDFQSTEEKDEISLIGWLFEDNAFHQFSYDARSYRTETFGTLSVAGGFPDHFLKFLHPREGEHSAHHETCDPYTQAVLDVKSILGDLLMDEYENHNSLNHYYGGAYEAIVFDGEKFSKVGDTTFFKSSINLRKKDYLCQMDLFMAYDYVGDLLRIRTIINKNGVPERYQQLVRPITVYKKSYTTDQLREYYERPFEFNREFLCSRSTLSLGSSSYRVEYGLTMVALPRNQPIQFSFDHTGLHHLHNPNLIEQMRKVLHEEMARNIMGLGPRDHVGYIAIEHSTEESEVDS